MKSCEEAKNIIRNYYRNGSRAEDEPLFLEACQFLLETAGDMDAADELGGHYYDEKDFRLALKYYTQAADHDVPHAWIGLGYIWYYGRLGTRDYEKAYHAFVRALEILTGKSIDQPDFWSADKKVELDSPMDYDLYINAAYKLADMYHAGRCGKKDFARYSEIIFSLYVMMSDPIYDMVPDYHMPEIELRMSDICLEDGGSHLPELGIGNKPDAGYAAQLALDCLLDAKSRMASRLLDARFFGNFSIMKSIVLKIHSLSDPDAEELDLYDLYFILQKPCTVTFRGRGEKRHTIVAELDEHAVAVCLDGKWYRTADELIMRGSIDGCAVPEANHFCSDIRVMS